jgi:ubiquinone/menaquinone biosynthesis C-methylase UbiE
MLVTRGYGKLHLAPIGDHPQRILDIGCGTGIWAIEMGRFNKHREIIFERISDVSLT